MRTDALFNHDGVHVLDLADRDGHLLLMVETSSVALMASAGPVWQARLW